MTRKPVAPLHIVTGDELLLVMEAVDEIRAHAREQGYEEREIFTADARFDWSVLQQWGQQSSLFGTRRLLDLRIPSGKPGREGGAALEMLCQNLPRDAVTLITLPAMDRQSRSSKWFKALVHHGRLVEIKSIRRDQLAYWIKSRLEQQQQTADREALQFFVERVEGNLLAAHQEIRKLSLLYPPGQLSFEQIRSAILDVARYDVFQLSEALLMADTARYSRVLSGLRGEGVAPPLMLAVLADQVRQLLTLRLALDSRPDVSLTQLMTAQRIWSSRQKLVATALRRTNRRLLEQALQEAAEIDRMIKGVAQGDVWTALLNLGLCLAGNESFCSDSHIVTRSAHSL